MQDRAREEAVLVYILYLHKKTERLSIPCTGYECFKGNLVIYLDIPCFDLTVALPNKKYNNNYITK